jgi:hypothetical protein
MSELKSILIPAASAFVLSLLTGILFGVGFLTVLLRAFLFGIIFGAAGFGIKSLLRRFLPELFGQSEDADFGEGNSEDAVTESFEPPETNDRAVDIVVEGDEFEASGLYTVQGDLSDDQYEAVDAEVEPVMDDEGGDESTKQGYNDTVEDGDAEDLEPMDDLGGGSLPDLDSFSDSFQSVADSQEIGESHGSEHRSQEFDVLGTQQDTATMAKAVRTFMKKDQEG